MTADQFIAHIKLGHGTQILMKMYKYLLLQNIVPYFSFLFQALTVKGTRISISLLFPYLTRKICDVVFMKKSDQ